MHQPLFEMRFPMTMCSQAKLREASLRQSRCNRMLRIPQKILAGGASHRFRGAPDNFDAYSKTGGGIGEGIKCGRQKTVSARRRSGLYLRERNCKVESLTGERSMAGAVRG